MPTRIPRTTYADMYGPTGGLRAAEEMCDEVLRA
jgi:hypothetical protein